MKENENMRGLMETRGAARTGQTLLAGLMRCGNCGRRFNVRYSGRSNNAQYECRGAVNEGGPWCKKIAAKNIDPVVADRMLEIIQPAAVTASLRAAEENQGERAQQRKSKELALEQARYETDRVQRQYDAVEPENRTVATELEKRWNRALEHVGLLEKELAQIPARDQELEQKERARLLELAGDLETVWHNERSDMSLKKRIARTLIEEVVVDGRKNPDCLIATIRWAGGLHSEVQVKRNSTGQHRRRTDQDTIELIRDLARTMPDMEIARTLNRLGLKTGAGHSWKESRVASVRHYYGIERYTSKKREELGVVNMDQAAQRLGVSPQSIKRMIQRGILAGRQAVAYAPTLIAVSELEKEEVKKAVVGIKEYGRIPLPENPNQKTFIFK